MSSSVSKTPSGPDLPVPTVSSRRKTTSSRISKEDPLEPGPQGILGRDVLDLDLADRLAEGGLRREIGGVSEESQVVFFPFLVVPERLEGLLDALEDEPALGLR